MLLWAGLLLLVTGAACLPIDRQAAHQFHDIINQRWLMRIHKTTDWAKGGHWLVIASATWLVAETVRYFWSAGTAFQMLSHVALAFLASLAIGSLILHTMKIFLGRRRPRDELELGLYGFMPWRFDLQYDSFPSGHALTIFCVAVIACGAMPMLSPLWFAIALYLATTRALLTAHFLSDVFVGAGIGLLVTRETVLIWFPELARGWF